MDERRLALTRCGHGSVLAFGCGLGHAGANDGTAGLRCIENGDVATPESGQRDSAPKEKQPVLLGRLPAVDKGSWLALKHVCEGKLPEQRPSRNSIPRI